MTTRTLLPELLQALDDGRISAEEAVRASIRGVRAMRVLLSRSLRRGCRLPTVHPITSVPDAVAAAALDAVKRRIGRSRNVLSVHWGVARRRGRRTAEAGVVVRVRQKLRPSRLRARRMRAAPAHVPIRRGGRLYRIRVDVQLEPGYAELQHIDFIRPADHGLIRRNGAAIGTLGGVVSTGGARFAVTAGHVAALIKGGNADCVDDEAGAFALGPVRANQFNAGTDIAAIGPVPQVPADAVLGNTIARNPTPVDTHHRVRLMLAGASTPIESHIDDVNRTRSFDTAAGVITMSGLTAIGRVTVAGDSGAPALDDGGALVGFVVGADALNTYLLPARRALDDLENAL